jgi:xanthine dehydrogenase accessory factor
MRREPVISQEQSSNLADPKPATDDFPGGHRGMLTAVRDLRQRGQSFVVCLVVLTKGSTYRKAGALAAVVSGDGTQRGVVSGGCLEPDLALAALRVLNAQAPEIIAIDTESDDDVVFGSGSGCRGRMSVLLVPVLAGTSPPLLNALETADQGRLPLKLALAIEGPLRSHGWCWCGSEVFSLGTGPPGLLQLKDEASGEHHLLLGGRDTLCAVLTVRQVPRVILVGAGPELPALLRIGREMGWHLTVIDHRAAAIHKYAGHSDHSIVARPAAGLAQLAEQAYDGVVVMTHTAANDLEALIALSLRTERYIGLLGPPARRDELFKQLDPAQQAALAGRVRSPVGLNLGGDGPEVLALSIAAELQQFLVMSV